MRAQQVSGSGSGALANVMGFFVKKLEKAEAERQDRLRKKHHLADRAVLDATGAHRGGGGKSKKKKRHASGQKAAY